MRRARSVSFVTSTERSSVRSDSPIGRYLLTSCRQSSSRSNSTGARRQCSCSWDGRSRGADPKGITWTSRGGRCAGTWLRIPENGELREAVVHMEGLAERGGTTRVRPPGDAPIRPLTEYRQKVLRAQRVAAPYPYELIRILTPPPGSEGTDFPAGRFVEHDLDSDGRLVPVDRPYGQNSANLVVGLTTNYTAKVPEGMTRVAILGDPTRSLGALAEPECRRIIAALDLAERERLPLEWFALSSGARIAMDSANHSR